MATHQGLLGAQPFVLQALSPEVRERVAISTTWKTDRKTPWVGSIVAFFFNSFRYSPSGSLHATLVHASGLLDHRWSILFLVRGGTPTNGLIANVDPDIGLLAAEFDVPIVPVQITGLDRRIPLLSIPHRDTISIEFCEPIQCKSGMSYRDVQAILELPIKKGQSTGSTAPSKEVAR